MLKIPKWMILYDNFMKGCEWESADENENMSRKYLREMKNVLGNLNGNGFTFYLGQFGANSLSGAHFLASTMGPHKHNA